MRLHFGYAKVRYRGLSKNGDTQRIALLLGFSNLLIAGRYATGWNAGPSRPVSARTAGNGSEVDEFAVSRSFPKQSETLSPWNGFPITKRVPDALRRSETGLDQTFPRGLLHIDTMEIGDNEARMAYVAHARKTISRHGQRRAIEQRDRIIEEVVGRPR